MQYSFYMAVIYVIGARGSGKSVTGKLLAEKLGYEFFDQDLIFYNKNGNILDYIDINGWSKFCDEMFELLNGLFLSDAIVSTGASALMNNEKTEIDMVRWESIKGKGSIVLLAPCENEGKAAKICFIREKDKDKRLLGDRQIKATFEEFSRVYSVVFQSYKKICDFIIFDNNSPESAVSKVCDKLSNNNIIKI